MKGSKNRSFTREPGVGICKGCGREALGMTTVELRPWADPVEYRYHWCDGCSSAAVERPLEVVLLEHLNA